MSMAGGRSKNRNRSSTSSASPVLGVTVLAIVAALTVLRLHLAFAGDLNEQEALLSVCSFHPQGAYVEGPAGVPLLLSLFRGFLGLGVVTCRWISVLAALLLSWSVWWMTSRLAPRSPSLALWAILALNLLPSVNLATLIMDGAMLSSSVILMTLVAGWNTLTVPHGRGITAWVLFGVSLGVGTLYFTPLGLIFPIALIARVLLRKRSRDPVPWAGVFMALVLLLAGFIPALAWNAGHNWIEWSSVAEGFESYSLVGVRFSLTLVVTLSALTIPFLILLTTYGSLWRKLTVLILLGMAGVSGLMLLYPGMLPALAPGLPSPFGVRGMGDLAQEIVSLRQERPDSKGGKAFLISSTSGLAALLGEKIQLCYPECPGAPPVFVAETPSMNSSYSLWPSYADAVAPAAKDLLYSEEKFVSPFLGRNALYITTESAQELPQTITSAFGAVGLLKEEPIISNGQQTIVRIYQCEGYRSLAL